MSTKAGGQMGDLKIFKEIGSGGAEVFVISLVVVWMMVNVIFSLEVDMRFPDKRKVGKAQCRALETSERWGLKSTEKQKSA